MASNFDMDASSEEESLSAVKRKADENMGLSDKNTEYSGNNDNVLAMEEVLIKVEVEEVDENETAIDYSKADDPLPSTSKRKKRARKYPCVPCGAMFESTTELREHLLIHQVETRHKCEECGRCFDKAFSLRMHKKVHEDKQYKCPLCELTFPQKINMGRHLMSHDRKEECSKCFLKFHTTEQLQAHYLKMHDGTVKKRTRAKQKRKENSETEVNKNGKAADVKTEIVEDTSGREVSKDNESLKESLKREDLNHNTQCAIVSKVHKGRSISDICRLYHVTPEIINEIWEERDEYTVPRTNGKKNTKQLNNILDAKILEWFNKKRSDQMLVTGKMLQDTAESIAADIGFVAFNGSHKWLDRFKARYKITLRINPVKRDMPSPAADSKWKKAFFKEQWCDVRLGFEYDDIYTADEVGLYFNASKGRIKKQGGKKFIHGYVKDRLSVFLCANATGSDKKQLLVCGVDDPLIHSHRDVETLPVRYIRHSQAHFTTKMFESYIKNWNSELIRSNKKALLLLDRATIHTKTQLSNLRLCFVPWKASVGLMPVKNGIFTRFRDEFRKLLLEEKAINVVKGVDRNLACLEALYILEKAWRRVPSDVIVGSFKATGYDVVVNEDRAVVAPSKDDEEEICQMLKDYDVESYFTDLSNLDMYLTVDEELVTGQGTNCSVFGGNHKVDPLAGEKEAEDILPVSTELPETGERESAIKRNRAMEDLEIVRKYLIANNTSYEMYCHFMEVEKCLYKRPIGFE